MIQYQNIKYKNYGLFFFKIWILLFWGLWFGIACCSNIIDLLHFHGIMLDYNFYSGNYLALKNVISVYQTPQHMLNILFYLDILIQGIIAILFISSAVSLYRSSIYCWKLVNLAFIVSIVLWGVFLIMEEIFIAYQFEATHIRLSVFEIVSLLMFHLLPNTKKAHDK